MFVVIQIERERAREHGAHGVEIEMFRRKESPEGPNLTKRAQQQQEKEKKNYEFRSTIKAAEARRDVDFNRHLSNYLFWYL